MAAGEVFTPLDGVVQLELSELLPDTTYAITFFAADGTRRSRVARFRTAVPAGASRVIRFGGTSCLGRRECPLVMHGPFRRMRSSIFFLLLGDTIYADQGSNQFDFVQKFDTALYPVGAARHLCGHQRGGPLGTTMRSTTNWSWGRQRHPTDLPRRHRCLSASPSAAHSPGRLGHLAQAELGRRAGYHRAGLPQ